MTIDDVIDELNRATKELQIRRASGEFYDERDKFYKNLTFDDLCNHIIRLACRIKKTLEVDMELYSDEEHYGYYDSTSTLIRDILRIEESKRNRDIDF